MYLIVFEYIVIQICEPRLTGYAALYYKEIQRF